MYADYEARVTSRIATGELVEDAQGGLRDRDGGVVPRTGPARMAQLQFQEAAPLTTEDVSRGQEAGEVASNRKSRKSVQQLMLELIEKLIAAGWMCFKSTDGRYFVSFGGAVLSLDSEADLDDLCGKLMSDFRQPMSGTNRKVLRDLLVQRAASSSPVKVYCRTAPGRNGELFLDLADEKNNVVKITGGGWQVISLADAQVKFERRKGMLALPVPAAAGATMPFADEIAKQMNLPPVRNRSDPTDIGVQARAGVVAAATAWLRRKGTSPLMLLTGAMGSGKTWSATRLKQLIDPDEAPSTPNLGKEEKDIMLAARSQLLVVLDNASSINPAHSDVFCAVLDGTGYASRALYTNGDRFVMTTHCGLAMTSIRDELITREDLLDRTIRIEVEPLSGIRRSVEDLEAEWTAALPTLLGGLLDLMAAGLRGIAAVKQSADPKRLPRLIDMALFAEAAMRDQGWREGLCIDALLAAREAAVQDNLNLNPIAAGIAAVVKDADFEGTMSELRARITALGGYWSDAMNSLPRFSSAVTRVLPQLTQWGIAHLKNPRTAGSRTFRLTKTRG